MKIAILGAPGTGKTQLAHALTLHFLYPAALANDLNWVIADAPPLMAAVYADLVFNDFTFYDLALAQHQLFNLTLVLGLDLPNPLECLASTQKLSRDAVDARLRSVLAHHKLPYKVIYGLGADRLEAALNAIAPLREERLKSNHNELGRWQSRCEKCSDPVCEHRLFTGQLKIGSR